MQTVVSRNNAACHLLTNVPSPTRLAAPCWPKGLSQPRPTGMVQHRARLSLLRVQTKWAVSGLVFVVLVAAHNEWAAWAVVGAVLSSFLCKVGRLYVHQQAAYPSLFCIGAAACIVFYVQPWL